MLKERKKEITNTKDIDRYSRRLKSELVLSTNFSEFGFQTVWIADTPYHSYLITLYVVRSKDCLKSKLEFS